MASSTSASPQRERRRQLLAILIHGFMGSDASFQQFPAHLHAVLSASLTASHTVRVKIYPRYRSRRAMEFARDDFSRWLEPHEGPDIDVVLLGHSLGGILAADVALLRSASNPEHQRHCILGTISLDTPFLGLHPGVIVSGIGSLFRPKDKAPTPSRAEQDHAIDDPAHGSPVADNDIIATALKASHSESSLNLSEISELDDANFNPVFSNDARFQDRKGWERFSYFINKHSTDLHSATRRYVVSHLEHGGCLADYPGLKARYTQLRALEDVDDMTARQGFAKPRRRVRFVNYYTASTGRPKQVKLSASTAHLIPEGSASDLSLLSSSDLSFPAQSISEAQSKTSSQQDLLHTAIEPSVDGSLDSPDDSSSESSEEEPSGDGSAVEAALGALIPIGNPPLQRLPQSPSPPQPPDLERYTDKDLRKIVERDYKRALCAYKRGLKDHASAMRDRQKLLKKWTKPSDTTSVEGTATAAAVASEDHDANHDKATAPLDSPGSVGEVPTPRDPSSAPTSATRKKPKKFCMLPTRVFGGDDACWVRVDMVDVDEVGAHCGLFVPGPHYEKLVGEVALRIEEWVAADATRRAIWAMQGWAEEEHGFA